jgi:fatty acid desaturase
VLLGLGLSVVALAVDSTAMDAEIERVIADNATLAGEVTVEQVRVAVLVLVCGLGLWALAAAGLAALAWTGRAWAWVLLCVSAGLAAGLLLVVTVVGGIVAVIPLAATAGSLALLIRPEVREWFRR